MKINTKLITIIIIISIVLSTGCVSNSNNISDYQTGALKEIQKVIPFTIIMPKYLPSGIRSSIPNFLDMSQGLNSKDSRRIGIMYNIKESNNYISIEEENATAIVHPSQDSSTFFYIDNIEILEEPSTDFLFSDKIRNPVGLLYEWSQNGIQFTIRILGYDKDECWKVVESIIR